MDLILTIDRENVKIRKEFVSIIGENLTDDFYVKDDTLYFKTTDEPLYTRKDDEDLKATCWDNEEEFFSDNCSRWAESVLKIELSEDNNLSKDEEKELIQKAKKNGMKYIMEREDFFVLFGYTVAEVFDKVVKSQKAKEEKNGYKKIKRYLIREN